MSYSWTTHNSKERAKAWRTSIFHDLEVLDATYLTHTFPRHVHEEFCIGIVISGKEKISYRGASYLAGAGSLVILQPDEVHSNCAADEGGWSYKVFYPSLQLIKEVGASQREYASIPFFPNPVIQDQDIFKRVLHLHTLLESPQRGSLLEKESYLLLTLQHLLARYTKNLSTQNTSISKHNKVVNLIKEYLQVHMSENPSLQQLCQLTNLSPYYLTRIFSSTVGIPPHAYLNQLRIFHAKRLLAENWKIAEVAQETGFTDQSHFTKTFKTLVGVTPGQYCCYANDVNH